MAGNTNRGLNRMDHRVLPAIIINSAFFPFTNINFGKSPEKFGVSKTEVGTEYLALISDTKGAAGKESVNIGIVCILQKASEDYLISGKSRAEAVETWQDKKRGLLARIKDMEDVPDVTELTEVETPMLFSCVEFIRRLLKKWQEKIPESESELYKKIGKKIKRIEAGRREKEIIYSLSWHILVDFPDFFSSDFKEEMLKTNKVIDRLQSVAEKLQQEISTFRYAESFADADSESPIKLENGISDK